MKLIAVAAGLLMVAGCSGGTSPPESTPPLSSTLTSTTVVEVVATSVPSTTAAAPLSTTAALPPATSTSPPTSTAPSAATRTYVFPIDPPESGSYSPGGHNYPATDIFADEGARFVAVTAGIIQGVSREDTWDPDANDGANRAGLFVSLIGDDGVRYYGSHLSAVADGIEAGVRVESGQLLGLVGRSGNARDTPPHLHFGISRPSDLDDWAIRRGEVDPIPYLDAWKSGSPIDPPSF